MEENGKADRFGALWPSYPMMNLFLMTTTSSAAAAFLSPSRHKHVFQLILLISSSGGEGNMQSEEKGPMTNCRPAHSILRWHHLEIFINISAVWSNQRPGTLPNLQIWPSSLAAMEIWFWQCQTFPATWAHSFSILCRLSNRHSLLHFFSACFLDWHWHLIDTWITA